MQTAQMTTKKDFSKDKKTKKEERRLLRKRLLAQIMIELKPIALGSIAMVASTLCNQGTFYRMEFRSIFIVLQ